jgi:hypothetical protein
LKVVTIVQLDAGELHRAGFRHINDGNRGGEEAPESGRTARADPADEHGEFALKCRASGDQSSGLTSLNQASPVWSTTWTAHQNGRPLAQPRSGHCRHGFVGGATSTELLYGFVIVRIDRKGLAWIGVPTAEWIARQITKAFPGRCSVVICDRDRIYGAVVCADCEP